MLGQSENLPSIEVLEALQSWIVKSYGGKKRPEDVKTIPQLRWYLFTKFLCEVSKLPPTTAAFKYKVFRSHYVTLVLKISLLPMQNLPSPLDYGWERVNTSYLAIMTDELPAPLALVELSSCSCKTRCCNNRCKCYKNHLSCSDMCKCTGCENNDVDHSDEELYYEADDDDDYEIDDY